MTRMFGGFWLPEYETVLDDAAATATGDATPIDDGTAGDVVPEPVAAEDTPAAASSWDDPAFLEAVDQRAADLLEARLAEISTDGQPVQQPDTELDLDPFGDNFGPNLIQAIRQIVQPLEQGLGSVQQTLGSAEDQQRAERGDKVINEILDTAGVTGENARSATRELAEAYLPAMKGLYGEENPRAADAAMSKAIKTVQGLTSRERQAGAAAEIDRLAQVAGAAGQPAGGGGAIINPAPASSPSELLARTFGTPTNL